MPWGSRPRSMPTRPNSKRIAWRSPFQDIRNLLPRLSPWLLLKTSLERRTDRRIRGPTAILGTDDMSKVARMKTNICTRPWQESVGACHCDLRAILISPAVALVREPTSNLVGSDWCSVLLKPRPYADCGMPLLLFQAMFCVRPNAVARLTDDAVGSKSLVHA